MARIRNPNRDKALELYKESAGTITNREISKILGEDEKKIAVWKQRDKWSNVVQQNKKRCTTKKKGAPKGNKNAEGHQNQSKNESHGFFVKWLPEETREIIGHLEERSPIDLLWDNIQLQYAAILRAQNIMHVKNQKDKTITPFNIEQAWDKQGKFLQAQSRAMSTLMNMIRQYDDLTKSDLATEEQKARIEKIKAEVVKISGEGEEIEDLTETDALIYEKKTEKDDTV